jgi:c-di-GMP-related signal transduction protein
MGNVEMRYHQVNKKGKSMTGVYFSRPKILENEKMRLQETNRKESHFLNKYNSGYPLSSEVQQQVISHPNSIKSIQKL